MPKKKKDLKGERAESLNVTSLPLPIKWENVDGIPSIYASNVLIFILENEFKLSFFEAKPQLRIDPNSPLPSEVRADCVSNIILNPQKIPALIDALQQQYKNYEQSQTAKKTDIPNNASLN